MTQEQEERLDATKLEKVPFIAEDIYNKSMTQPNWEDRYQEIWAHIDTPENWSWIKLEIKSFIQKSIQQAREEVVREIYDGMSVNSLLSSEKEVAEIIEDALKKALQRYADIKGLSLTPNTEIQ